jgi:hypothetical protein
MGTYQQGVLGAYSGKVGPVVGSKWKDRDVVRARPRKSKKKAKPEVIAQRARFSLASKFLTATGDLLKLTFPEFSARMTARNSALAVIIKEAISGEYPDFKLHYDRIKVARGSVAGPWNAKAASTEAGKLQFNWLDNSDIGTSSKADDKAVLVAYCPEVDTCIFSDKIARRSDATGVLQVDFFKGKEAHTWIAFMDVKGKRSSDSVYTGTFAIA